MSEKKKYRAEIEAKMAKFDKTLNEIKAKQDARDWSRVDFNIGGNIRKREDVELKMKALEEADSSSWERVKSEIDSLVLDIDDDLRQALVHFS